MKRQTAIKYVHELNRRLCSIDGVLSTPNHNYDFVKFERAWLFGSTAKGAENPNDVDIFIELQEVGKHNRYVDGGEILLDKEYYRRYGMKFAKKANDAALMWLRKGMKKISFHIVGDDLIFDTVDKKIMIYPQNDFLSEL